MYAAIALPVQVDATAFVPPSRDNVIFVAPPVTKDVKIFSIDCGLNAQFLKVRSKAFVLYSCVRVSTVLVWKLNELTVLSGPSN